MSEKRAKYEAAVRDDVLIPTWERMKEQAKILHDSGFFPKAIKKSSQALAVMLAGRELGLGPMESLRSIYIVDGATCISSGLMAAMIWQAGHSYEILESTDTVCNIRFTRNTGKGYTHSFTIEDAKKAGLAGKQNWTKYAKAMLFARCMMGGSRAFMPDVSRKMYTPEEMGAAVTVSESGDVVIDVEATVIEDSPPATNGKHWTVGQDWKQFWVYWKDKGISHEEMHKAAGVKSMTDYTGSKDDLRAAVDAYIAAQIEAQPEPADVPTDKAEFDAAPQEQLDGLGFGK